MQIEWLPQALADFDEAMAWIAERNSQAAQQTATSIFRQVNQLNMHPLIGRIGRVANTRELVVSLTHFVVPYRVNTQKNLIEILALMHNARQWPESFE